MGGYHRRRTGRTGLGGTGSPAQGVFGASCRARGEPSSFKDRAHRPGGDGESSPGGGRSLLQGQWGAIIFGEPGAPAWGGRGVQPRGVFGASCKARGGPSSFKNRAHRPGGDGESSPGGGRGILQGQWGAICFGEPGAPAWGGRGVQPRGCSEPPARPMGGLYLRRTGRTGPGGTGVQPRGCSEPPARPMGGHYLRGTGRIGLRGTGRPAQGVVGASCKARGEPSSFKSRAHWPGGGRGVYPGGRPEQLLRGGRRALWGRWGGSRLVGVGPPAWGGGGGGGPLGGGQ